MNKQTLLTSWDDYDQLSKVYRTELEPFYQEYISTISNDVMAISLELATFIVYLCKEIKPSNILDLGSGFTSFIFHYYFEQEAHIWSVDDDNQWLAKTEYFLNKHGFYPQHLINWSDFLHINGDQVFDFISYDLGNMQSREQNLKQVIALTRPDGWIILDDLHVPNYGQFVLKNTDGKRLFDLRPYTIDKYSRFSCLYNV